MPDQSIRAGVQIDTTTATLRDRLKAYEGRTRFAAISEFPELKKAFTIEDASQRFAAKFIKDAAYRLKFERITKDYIRGHLLRDQPLPELIRHRGVRELERQQDHSRW